MKKVCGLAYAIGLLALTAYIIIRPTVEEHKWREDFSRIDKQYESHK